MVHDVDRSAGNSRFENEIAHGKYLADGGAERIWGWGTPAGKLRAERRARLIVEGTRLRPGARALEIGCGTGMFTAMFASSGASIVAVDLSEDLLESARKRGLENVTFLAKNFEDCEVDGPFDAVIGSSILHHLEIDRALPKIRALLKPGGVMSFAEPNMLNPQIAIQKNIPFIKRLAGDSPDETAFFAWRLGSQLRSLGFESVEVTPFDWLHPSMPSALIGAAQKLGRIAEATPIVRQFAGSLLIRGTKPL
jgi:2-polyprenyl-3-methyl-5-hydroxy-6-metoxy-1,4-benzoquinol methylase